MATPSFFGLSPQETALALEQERMQQLPQNKPYFAGDINFAVANQNFRELGPRVRAAVQERSFKPLFEGGLGGFRDPRMQRAMMLEEARQEVASSGIDLNANPIDYYNSAFTALMKRGLVDEANMVRTQAMSELQQLKPTANQQALPYEIKDGVKINKVTGETTLIPGATTVSGKPTYQTLRTPDGKFMTVEKGSEEEAAAFAAGAVPYGVKQAAPKIQEINGVPHVINQDGTATPVTVNGQAVGSEKQKKNRLIIDSLNKNVLDTVREATDLVSKNTTGFNALLKNLPETESRMLANRIKTITANLGFDRLSIMRDMSPTGGALGQVAVQELTDLQASVANLDQFTRAEDLIAQLNKIERHYNNWRAIVEGSVSTQEVPSNGAPSDSDLRKQADKILEGNK